MSRVAFLHLPRGLRLRMTFLLMAGVLFAGVGFEVLLVSVTRHSEYQEMESRARSVVRLLAERSPTSVLVGDHAELMRQVVRVLAEPDIVGVAIYATRGPALAERSYQAGLGIRPRCSPGRSTPVRSPRPSARAVSSRCGSPMRGPSW